MALVVSDANVFIDLEEGGILAALFRLPEAIAVPDVLFEEELRDRHAHLLELGLRVLVVKERGVERAVALAAQYRKPNRNDLFALALAEQESCPLLTGDRFLREAAVAEGVTVHGTLWVTERMVEARALPATRLRAAYARMREGGRRLPWGKVEALLERLGA
jgi:predicted nucleic acid-binding protein